MVVLPDNDDPGTSHAYQVAASLSRVTNSIKVLPLPDLNHGQDVYDWFTAGNTAEDLLRLTEAAPPWESQNGPELLDAIVTFIRRFVILSQQQAEAIALWIVHTHVLKAADTTPYLNITSPEKRSGKTLLLEILELQVARPWFTGRVTAAVLARKVDAECPTLLLDESDAAFKGNKEYAETLRSILNTGYRRGGKTSVCVGQGAAIGYRDLSTFCPKAIAGIGKLPDTVADRSIPITLKRRAPNEYVERFRRRSAEREASPLRQQIIQWAGIISPESEEPEIPEQLRDRAADCWEPLLLIADAAGGEWPRKARDSAVALMTGVESEDESLGVRLLADIRFVLPESGDSISSADLLSALMQIEESPWGDLRGKPLDARRLASLLKPYGIRPHTFRIDDKTPKGYQKIDFRDAWNRYLPVDASLPATSATPGSAQVQTGAADYPQQPPLETPVVADNPQSYPEANVADVADKTGEMAETAGISQMLVVEEGGWEVEI